MRHGEISIRLAEKGFEVTGIDLSEEMLSFAQQKVSSSQPILFLQQDMREITGFDGQFDAVVICCDSLNYLKTKNDVIETFKSVFRVLKPEGILLFDVHSSFKIAEVFPDSTFADQDEDISYIWQSFAGSDELSVIHDMSFLCGTEKRMIVLMRHTSKERSRWKNTKKCLRTAAFSSIA